MYQVCVCELTCLLYLLLFVYIMERISEQQRAAITRMSDTRLRSKLVQAGYKPDDMESLER